MNRIATILLPGIILYCILSCRPQLTFIGDWNPVEVTVWSNYGDSFYINLNNKSISYDSRKLETKELLTIEYKKNLFDLLSKSYLNLNPDSSFDLEDHGFFSQALSDTAWQNRKKGVWRIEANNSILILTQSTLISKKYSILEFSRRQIKLGELHPESSKPITEILLTR